MNEQTVTQGRGFLHLKGDKYAGEGIVHYGIVAFMLLTGWWLAWVTAQNPDGTIDAISFAGQFFGFGVTTWLIVVVYTGLKNGKYVGEQRVFANRLYSLLLVDEGFTIFAKYYEPVRPYYLMWIAFSIPFLAYSAFKLQNMDEQVELDTIKRENRTREKMASELARTYQKLLTIDRQKALVMAATKQHRKYEAALLRRSRGWGAFQNARIAADNSMPDVLALAGMRLAKQEGDAKRKKVDVKVDNILLTASSGDGASKSPFM